MRLGLEVILTKHVGLLRGKRIGILAHAASLDLSGKLTVSRILQEGGGRVTTLFGPEHGISTVAEDMESVGNTKDEATGLTVYSLYGDTLDSLKPTAEMLEDIDVLIVDLQDIGSRYYTYVWTTCLCAEACKAAGKQIIVCDRPNPIGGVRVEGGEILPGYESFVGLHSLPVRHGMTIGEIVQLVNDREGIGADLKIIEVEGWRRSMSWGETGVLWTNPSPNMRSYTAALLYPGMCLLEGTNLSEGRGTDTPFETVGAPYIDSDELMKAFEKLKIDGVRVAPTAFIPTRQKWKSTLCHGVRFVISDAEKFNSYLTGLVFVWLVYKLYDGKGFKWRDAPYEFVTTRPAIDLLTGSSIFREGIEKFKMDDLVNLAATPKKLWEERKTALIYR